MSKDLITTPSEELVLNSRGYHLLKKLGEGSYAKVYLTDFKNPKDPDKVMQLACKVIDTSKAPKDFVKKFLPRELDILVKLNHPHIVHIQNIFQRRNKYFIFMRFAENGDLLEFIVKKGAVSEAQSRVWLRQICLAVQYMHEMEIAHRDLKCENALITNNYNLKLADFGFSRFVIDASGKRVTSETYCGSLSYAAPEILRGIPYHGKIADIWSIGVILYIMLNKAMPFDDGNIKKLYEQQTNKRWRFRAKVADSLSEQVKKLTGHCLEPDVTKRWKIEQILTSDWIAMDPRLLELNAAEKAAIKDKAERKKKKEKKIKEKETKTEVEEEYKGLNKQRIKHLKHEKNSHQVAMDKKTKLAVEYLTLWKEDKTNWKFKSLRESFLIYNSCNPVLLPDDYFDLTLEYLCSIKGVLRNKVVEVAKKVKEGDVSLQRAKLILEKFTE
ncbi:PREDICTED: testis-specific serine/threonine-protein kinase 3-like [Nicrophorus vespilloides]|uniref:Testis-specific serine/threonine-protein kinase 3-like n=1 Tax=Nicrophorus vespilloides TaxID=110193 RepID=A0ABM1M509_NICVS|nr:PREDICTED: testis-specific serine/threonine-protein kinase 3-like [Nicrophorus vespilloides]